MFNVFLYRGKKILIFFGDNIINLIINFIIFKKIKIKNWFFNEKKFFCMCVVFVIVCNCLLIIEYMYNYICVNVWYVNVYNK